MINNCGLSDHCLHAIKHHMLLIPGLNLNLNLFSTCYLRKSHSVVRFTATEPLLQTLLSSTVRRSLNGDEHPSNSAFGVGFLPYYYFPFVFSQCPGSTFCAIFLDFLFYLVVNDVKDYQRSQLHKSNNCR